MRSLILGSIFAVLVLQCRFALASVDSIGPNGIHSSGLPLTGAGIDIGQVELERVGDPGTGKDESKTLTNSTVDPEQVFFRQSNTNFAPNYNLVNETHDHTQRVAGIMISTDALAQGVSQQADLFSVGINPQSNVPVETTYQQIAVSTNHLATLAGQRLWAINMSILANTDAGADADGTSTVTSYVDWSARTHDILYVTGHPETNSFSVLADNFNGMAIVYSMKNGNKYREVGDENLFAADDFWIGNGDFTFPDIVAPGTGILMTSRNDIEEIPAGLAGTGTSFAAPHVTGTVALLQQHAAARIAAVGSPRWAAPNAQRHEVMKAVIMNSADKIEEGTITEHNGLAIPTGGLLGMERTVIDNNGDDWFDSEADDDADAGNIPLDDQMGVGHLNANRAFQQFSTGEFNDSNTVDVPVKGWDYGLLRAKRTLTATGSMSS